MLSWGHIESFAKIDRGTMEITDFTTPKHRCLVTGYYDILTMMTVMKHGTDPELRINDRDSVTRGDE